MPKGAEVSIPFAFGPWFFFLKEAAARLGRRAGPPAGDRQKKKTPAGSPTGGPGGRPHVAGDSLLG